MKKVFSSHSQVIHLWANQSQESARSKNVFFSDTSIYSYGTHYRLGELTEYRGVKVALINNTGYSNTTAKHIHNAWSSVSHMTRLKVGHDFDVFKGLISTQTKLVNGIMDHFSHLKFYPDYDIHNSRIIGQINEFNLTCIRLQHSDLKIDLNADFMLLMSEHVKNRNLKNAAIDAKKNDPKVIEEKRLYDLHKLQIDIQAWRLGGPLTTDIRNLRPMLLRVKESISETLVQTSGGAEVPLRDAIKLLSLIENKQQQCGEKVGAFILDTVNYVTGIVKIGCHDIHLSEAKHVLNLLNNSIVNNVSEFKAVK